MVLLFGAAQGAIVTVLLLARRQNRVANRLLAALTFAFGLRLVPYIIGYAGFYDVYPWLSFAPFALTLGYGPLLYLYVTRLTRAALPQRWWLHLTPALIQAGYDCAIFVQPLAFKDAWDDSIHARYVVPVQTVLSLLSLGIYVAAAGLRYRAYRRWLDNAGSDGEQRLPWLSNVLILFGLTVVLTAAFDFYDSAVRRLSYFDEFGLYVWYAAIVYYLALEGWRNAERAYPQPEVVPGAPAELVAGESIDPPNSRVAPEPDWPSIGAAWRGRVESAQYWRDPELTLVKLAAALDMSPAFMSRAVNDGLGQNFNEAINRLRVAAVTRCLADPAERRDLLEIALDAGFSSKASFNRSFKAFTGTTPTEYRRARRN